MSDPTRKTASPEPSQTGATIDPDLFIEVFRRNRFSPTATAAELRIPRTTVYWLMNRHPEVTTANDIPPADLHRQFLDCGGNVDRLAERLNVSRRALQIRLAQIFKDALTSRATEVARRLQQLHPGPDGLAASLTLDKATVDALRVLLGDDAVESSESLLRAVQVRVRPLSARAPVQPISQAQAGEDLHDVAALAHRLLRRPKR
jgi:hypothetical protein